jgi:LmbE family N-acetylglucosaminyl deacetylase
MILFSTHGDDEQLFFAGLLPYYANAKDYTVQVIYLTNHRNENDARVHEMLNGLWAVGCDTYPVFGQYYDFLYDNIKQTYRAFEHLGHPREEMVGFVVEQLRRFKPLVTVGHDFAGEYGHGQHMVYADLVAEAVTVSNNPEYYPESAEKYGLWDVPKSYFHLYEENPIVMDWDTPMEELDGMTPFEVTQKLGFPAHVSQQRAWFKYWLCRGGDITKASQIETYSPCLYGLYRSTVGPDTGLNDMFENVTPYGQVVEPEPEVIPEETQPEIVPPTPTAPPVAIPAPAVPKKQPELWIIAAGGIVLVVVLVILSVILRKRRKN